MTRYLGSKIHAFAAFVVPLFICAPLLFGVIALDSEISGATIFVAVGCVSCSVVWGWYVTGIRDQLYSWGDFQSERVRVRTIFSKNRIIVYEQCKGCGIGYYTHGVLNSHAGTKIYFIFLSYDIFDESFRSAMNLWKPSPTRVKVAFSPKLYDYLLNVLPPKQVRMLQRDYARHLG